VYDYEELNLAFYNTRAHCNSLTVINRRPAVYSSLYSSLGFVSDLSGESKPNNSPKMMLLKGCLLLVINCILGRNTE